MGKHMLGLLVVATLALAGAANATLLADRFGVTPSLNYIHNWEYSPGQYYTGYQFDVASLTPTRNLATLDYEVNDWFGRWSETSINDHTDYTGTGTWPSGSEPYDVEAMYFDDDGRYMYISIITSVKTPSDGIFVETREDLNIPVVQGDLSFDLQMSGSQTDDHGFNYNYGLDLVDEIRPGSGNVTALRSNTVGSTVYRTTGSGSTGAWYLGTPDGAVTPPNNGSFTNFDPVTAPSYVSNIGTATTSWTLLGLTYGGNSVLENNYATYLIEAVVPLDIFPRFEAGQYIGMMFLPGCRNDGNDTDLYIHLDGDLDMPEPGTYALMALGALALGYRLKRRRQS